MFGKSEKRTTRTKWTLSGQSTCRQTGRTGHLLYGMSVCPVDVGTSGVSGRELTNYHQPFTSSRLHARPFALDGASEAADQRPIRGAMSGGTHWQTRC